MATLYLSRLALDSSRRDAQRDLADCQLLHRRILSAFPAAPSIQHAREHYGMLYRVEQGRDAMIVLVQSREMPDWSRLPAGYLAQPVAVKRIDHYYELLQPGMELRFRLRANPTRRISDRDTTQGERWRGKRVELRREEDQLAWLRRKGGEEGFTLVAVRTRPDVDDTRIAPQSTIHGTRRDTGRLTFGSTLFEGRLMIADIARFRQALAVGLGSGKSYGFGLLSVAPCTTLSGVGVNRAASA